MNGPVALIEHLPYLERGKKIDFDQLHRCIDDPLRERIVCLSRGGVGDGFERQTGTITAQITARSAA